MDQGWWLASWLLVTLRIGLGLVAVLSVYLDPPRQVGGDWLNLLIRGGEPWSAFLSTWQRWDALWYQQIATNGYRADDGTLAFYPLYPLLVHNLAVLIGGQVVLAELLIASSAFLVAMRLLYRVACLDAGPLTARLAVLLTVSFPTGFFLLAPYTESLYLMLTLAAFWMARRGEPWTAGVAALYASLARSQGVFLVLPLAWEHLRQQRQQRRPPEIGLLAAGLPALGFFAVTAQQWLLTSEQSSPLQLQNRWGYRLVPPWEALAASWVHVAAKGDLIEGFNLACLLGFSLLAALALGRLPLGYALYVWPSLALLFTREMSFSPLMSTSRYTLVLFPCFVLLARFLVKRPWLAAGWLVVSMLLQVVLLVYWVQWGFVA